MSLSKLPACRPTMHASTRYVCPIDGHPPVAPPPPHPADGSSTAIHAGLHGDPSGGTSTRVDGALVAVGSSLLALLCAAAACLMLYFRRRQQRRSAHQLLEMTPRARLLSTMMSPLKPGPSSSTHQALQGEWTRTQLAIEGSPSDGTTPEDSFNRGAAHDDSFGTARINPYASSFTSSHTQSPQDTSPPRILPTTAPEGLAAADRIGAASLTPLPQPSSTVSSSEGSSSRLMSEADSRLMHLVKGLCGGALMGLESFNELRRRDPLSLGAEGLAPSMAALVEQPEEQLRTAVEWCHRRQVFQSLVDGSYKTVQQEFDVKGLLERLVRNDGEVVVVGSTRHAAADRTMLAIILEEVLSNCRKYRQPLHQSRSPRGSVMASCSSRLAT